VSFFGKDFGEGMKSNEDQVEPIGEVGLCHVLRVHRAGKVMLIEFTPQPVEHPF
jgi:hypothetical protein